MRVSELLTVGEAYDRRQLQGLLNTKDATINTGVFHPKGYDTILLFVTENTSADGAEHHNLLRGRTLEWDGQTSGRSDDWIIHHTDRGWELLLFYRERKRSYADAGFRYEGQLAYEGHVGAEPAHFTLRLLKE
ncbi:MAG TPA: hypothetical protein VKV26_03130 [Dehalococcoidia bacterium]|nr:hypothetical protein [Dehalococcoidia bacterium]